MGWLKNLLGVGEQDGGESSLGRYRIRKTGISRYDADMDFMVRVADHEVDGVLFEFGFPGALGRKAAEAIPDDVHPLLLEKPELEVYTDNWCNLTVRFRHSPDEQVVMGLAKILKEIGAMDFHATSAPMEIRDKLNELFPPRYKQ